MVYCLFTDIKLIWIECPKLSLTKVDDYDLYALLYAGSEDENVNSAQAAREAAEQANYGVTPETIESTEVITETEISTQQQTTTSGGLNTNSLLLIGGVVVLGIGGFAVFKLTGKKQKPKVDDSDEFEIDEDEE